MLPLRVLVLPYDSLSLTERAQALVLAREAGAFSARLLGPGADRTSGVLVWQRLVIEEALLRGILDPDEALPLLRRTLGADRSDPRLEAFLAAWGERGAGVAESPLRVIRGARLPGVDPVRARAAGRPSGPMRGPARDGAQPGRE